MMDQKIYERIKKLEAVVDASAELHQKCRTTVENGFCDFNKKALLTDIGLSLEGPLLALQKFDEEK